MPRIGKLTYNYSRLIMIVIAVLVAVAVYGISRININDNPVKWFNSKHEIRVADSVLNSHFGGTYMAYLDLEAEDESLDLSDYKDDMLKRLDLHLSDFSSGNTDSGIIIEEISRKADYLKLLHTTSSGFLNELTVFVEDKLDAADDNDYEIWDEAGLFIDSEKQRSHIFKDPDILRYISSLQDALQSTGVVGKSNSLSDMVKTVYRELISGDDKDFKIPDSSRAVAQCLITFQNSHRPQDLWHFVTP